MNAVSHEAKMGLHVLEMDSQDLRQAIYIVVVTHAVYYNVLALFSQTEGVRH